jgi:lipopolysaccharide/colanic/teichoic acid biosynthesis glycosyltransferase
MTTLEALVLASLVFASVPWLVYPLVLAFWRRPKTAAGLQVPSYDGVVSVLIPAHNEVGVIVRKLENTFQLDWPREKLEVIVCSDGSIDGTDELVARYRHHGVRLLRLDQRRGKASAINRLVEVASGDAVLLTDASAELPKDAVRALVARLCDPGVGLVSARYAVVPSGRADGAGEARYWSFDTALRRLAASRGVLLGAHGAGLMAWRGLLPRLPADTINDDYVLPLRVTSKGYRVAYAPECVVQEASTRRLQTVFFRAARIARGNLQMIRRAGPAWRDAALVAPLVFHKLPKTLGPAAVGVAAVLATAGAPSSTPLLLFAGAAGSALLGASLGAALTLVGAKPPRPLGGLAFAAASAAGATLGAITYPLFGADPRWRRESTPLTLDAPAAIPLRVRVLKRVFDVVGAGVGLLLAGPLLGILAIWIKRDSPGPAIYAQERCTYDGRGRRRTFRLYKLRSMREDAEDASGPVWATDDDPRVTRVGRFLRDSRLDELPQLLNVLRGDMSLVGPRPERPAFVDDLSVKVPGYDDRIFAVKPGITGWAQVHCGYDTSVESVREKLMYDLSYAAQLYRLGTWARMEATTVVRTLEVMWSGRGAR